jgi:hypothetical protein
VRELSSRKESTYDHERRQSVEGKGSRRRLVFAAARQNPRRRAEKRETVTRSG